LVTHVLVDKEQSPLDSR